MIEILTDSPLNAVQDLGRTGVMRLGVARGGAMDPLALTLGNLMLGNAPNAAGIEIAFFPFKLRFLARTAFALTGARACATLEGRALPPDWATVAEADQVLDVGAPAEGVRAYVSIAGGVDVPTVLGARGTDLKAGFGGLEGRTLRRGDRLRPGVYPHDILSVPRHGIGLSQPCVLPGPEGVMVRVIAAAEYAAFTGAAQTLLTRQDWRLTPNANRTGLRLEGAESLALISPLSLLSHGIVPGTVQIPPAGQPIVQMADANTCGGYPKIATVLECDLRLLAQARPGAKIGFRLISRDEGVAALRAEAASLASRATDIGRIRTSLAA